MYGCESWTIKKAECQRIDAFELWCWRRLLRDSWTARWSNQSIIKEINRKYSLEELKLKLSHLMRRANSLEKTLMLGEAEGRRRRGWPEDKMIGWYHQFNGHEFGQAVGDGEGQGSLECHSPCCHKESDMTEQLNTTTIISLEFQTNTSIKRASWYQHINWDPFNKQTLKCEVLKL